MAAALTPVSSGLTTTDPSATPTPAATPTNDATTTTAATTTMDELQAGVDKARRDVRLWQGRVRRLARQYRFARTMVAWERSGKWMPIIEVAAARYHVKADGIYRMMMHESGGQRFVGSSTSFKGLFQYCTGTWSASWNPWRHDSIYDGSSQIFATCYAVGKGMGRQMWTTTFASRY